MTETAPPPSHVFGTSAERRAWVRYWITDVLTGVSDRVITIVSHVLPLDFVSAFGAWIVPLVVRHTSPHWIDQTARNFKRFRPDLDDAAARAAAQRQWRNIGRTILEIPEGVRIQTGGRVTMEGTECLEAAWRANRPVVLMGTHTANWELQAHCVPYHPSEPVVHAMYMPPRNRFRHALTRRARLSGKVRSLLAPGPNTMRDALEYLRNGDTLMIYVDEYVRREVVSPSFGRPLRRRSNLAFALRLAALTGALPVFCWTQRLQGARFITHYRPFELTVGDGRETQAAADAVLRDIITDNLDHWFNLHVLNLEDGQRSPS